MSIGGGRICIGFFFLCSSLTAVLVIGLWLRWKFRNMPAIKARQKYAQTIMMILCYLIGVGWGVCALIFQYEEGGAGFDSYSSLVLCLVFGHYAAMDVYIYRVWLFYYKCKLQNEFEKVRRKPPNLGRTTIMKDLLDLTPETKIKIEITTEGEWKEDLVEKWPKPDSVRKSCFVRYRHILGRSMLNKAFWLLFWICECIVVTWTFQRRSRNKDIRWTTHELADEFFTMIAQLLCLAVLFFFPSDDMFHIKIELRLIFFISTVEIVLYYTFLYQIGTPVAYLSLAICELCIMVAITCSNWKAVHNRCCCSTVPILANSSYQLLDSNSDSEVTIIHILECESLFQAFEKHLKREFSLENLNFIVAVEHYRRLCENRAHTCRNRIGNLSHGKKTVRKTQEISMQPYGVFVVPASADTSNSSFVSTLTSTVNPLSSTMESELGISSHRRTPSDYDSTGRHGRKKTPRLSWIKSHVDFCGDKQSTAIFIFEEYCDCGAPQEINLSRRERNELREYFSHSNIDPGRLNTIFDNAFESVLDLLANDSLRRFRRHSSFSKIYKD